MSTATRLLVTLEGYAVEGGYDQPGGPSTCFLPTIALGRHVAPGSNDDLWHNYETVLDLVPALGVDGVRLGLEWARIEPRPGEVDESALARYRDVIKHAQSLDLDVTITLIDQAWPLWLGLESWLLPWVKHATIQYATRVIDDMNDPSVRVVVFSDAEKLVARGFLSGDAPPWRRGAKREAQFVRQHIQEVRDALDAVFGAQQVTSFASFQWRGAPDDVVEARTDSSADELYLRSLLRGSGPTSVREGLIVQRSGVWHLSDSALELAALLRV